ncbi:LAMI_0F03422g1_1 [Lachancea mirantina]|uniref:LAMI_0F03422g1_1 n=1 Tax=Lachancea mirantina TaxID=1230905 RepID=A0A1G4JX49_9SACH|nr:LAMI_0F03422g1_1 [Lachancea mirantina]
MVKFAAMEHDTALTETDLLEDFLFAGYGDGTERRGDVGNAGNAFNARSAVDEDIFSAFIKTELLQPQNGRRFTSPGVENAYYAGPSRIESVSPVSGLNVSAEEAHQLKESERVVNQVLAFGRSKAIQSAYVNSSAYLNIDGDALPMKMKVSGMPAASRVETQIRLQFTISPPPKEYIVHLPTDCISKQKFYLKDDITNYPRDIQDQMLYLEAFLVCASNGKPTYVCSRCVKREERRASRRKSGLCDNLLWCNNENRRGVVFNSKQVFALNGNNCSSASKSFELLARIVCYCRHHKEPEGFRLLFVLMDSKNNILAKDITTPIMIMDKKSTKENTSTCSSSLAHDSAVESTNTTDGFKSERSDVPHVTSTSDLSNLEAPVTKEWMSLSVKNEPMLSPTSMGGDSSEAHATDAYNQDRAQSMSSSAAEPRNSGFKRKRVAADEPSFSKTFSDHGSKSLSISHPPFSNSSSNVSLQQMNASTTHSQQPSSHIMTATSSMLQEISEFTGSSQSSVPFIHRVIPGQGPVKGGIEITLLGSNFKPGMIVKFGENQALSTQCWSDTTLVTYLPPSSTSGQVLVTILNNTEGHPDPLTSSSNSKAIFTYVDDTDRQLIELALQIVGLKMNGKLEDARNIAKRIVGNDGGSSNDSTPSSANQNDYNQYSNQMPLSDEMLLLRVIKLLNSSSNLSMCDEEGQTMLHLSCLKGYFQLASSLIRAGARVNAKDSFGLTPLHFACLNGDARIIRLLVCCKANVHSEASNGITPRDLFVVNHDTDDERYEDFLNEVLELLEAAGSDDDLSFSMGRKLSDSSFQSSVFDTESLNSLNDNVQVHISRMIENPLSDDESEGFEEYEEDGDEGLLGDDEVFNVTPRRASHPNALRPNIPLEGSSTGQDETSLWNRVLNAINDELPKYEDLFPTNEKEKGLNIINSVNSLDPRRPASSLNEESQTSSEDEEEALQARINGFFQQRQKFQNDKMLLFFWLPVAIVLLTSFMIFEFGQDGNSIHHLSQVISDYLRTGIAKLMLGNERVKIAFQESLGIAMRSQAISS